MIWSIFYREFHNPQRKLAKNGNFFFFFKTLMTILSQTSSHHKSSPILLYFPSPRSNPGLHNIVSYDVREIFSRVIPSATQRRHTQRTIHNIRCFKHVHRFSIVSYSHAFIIIVRSIYFLLHLPLNERVCFRFPLRSTRKCIFAPFFRGLCSRARSIYICISRFNRFIPNSYLSLSWSGHSNRSTPFVLVHVPARQCDWQNDSDEYTSV